MAWYMPKEKMNNNPLSKEIVIQRFKEKGFKIIDYCYKNNLTRMPCFDKEGYIVMVSLGSLNKNIKTYERFSPSCNEKHLLFNLNHYAFLHPNISKVLDWKYIKTGKENKDHILILCTCEQCKETFWTQIYYWKNGKNRCNKCSKKQSLIERKTKEWLEENNINFIEQYKFEKCKYKRALIFDFYLPDYNACIETDGEQHYKIKKSNYKMFSYTTFCEIQTRDLIKTKFCKENNIPLLRIKEFEFKKNNYKNILSNFIKRQQ